MKGWTPEQLAEVNAAIRLGEQVLPPVDSRWRLYRGACIWTVRGVKRSHYGVLIDLKRKNTSGRFAGLLTSTLVWPSVLRECRYVPANAQPFVQWERA